MKLSSLTLSVCLLGALSGCPSRVSDGNDAGAVGSPCQTSAECRASQNVCRLGVCSAKAPCQDDAECGLGESCENKTCRFTGCTEDQDCASGRCQVETFSCAECQTSAECPEDRPVCHATAFRCVACQQDADCSPLQAPYCDAVAGRCLYCREDAHCPNGLTCRANGVCGGVKQGALCPTGTACDVGLLCVNLNGVSKCEVPCDLYNPTCQEGQLCLKLEFANSKSLVFAYGIPQGVCHAPLNGLAYFRESCTRSATGSSCQPNLECVPESNSKNVCRGFCQPGTDACPPGEICHAFPGNVAGNAYGVCYADNGYGEACRNDGQCRSALACVPWNDPSAASGLSPRCAFAVGTAGAMAPCQNVPGLDGGVMAPDSVCASGACRGDSAVQSGSQFCFSSCETDADCQVDGRQGTCEAIFPWQNGNSTQTAKGCRPRCASEADCAEYGGSLTCRARAEGPVYAPTWAQSCGAQVGKAPVGATCAQNTDCLSGLCLREDGHGVSRAGVCSTPCADSAACGTSTGLPGKWTCASSVVWVNAGFDGLSRTSDDVRLKASLCTGGSCTYNAECGGGGVCVPDVDPEAREGARVLRCRMPTPAGTKTGGQACANDSECVSGACVALRNTDAGVNKACFQACGVSAACPSGATCREDGMRLDLPNGTFQYLTSCTP